MLVVEPGDSLKHIQTSKMLSGEETGLGLGSDGETSDYQRSTPSPGDTNDRITEVTEGLDKADSLREPESPGSVSWKPSPDLGFVDYVPFSDCHPRLGLQAASKVNNVKNVTESSNTDTDTANVLLSKSLKVDVEKLPTVMTSMVTSKNHPSLMFKRSEGSLSSSSRKRYTGVLGNNQRSASKKSPRFVSVDQRKTSLSKTTQGSKELLLHSNLFNSFRITKPKSNLKSDQVRPTRSKSAASKSGVNGIHFESTSFYKQSDLLPPLQSLPPTSATTSTVFSPTKTEPTELFSSNINFLDDKNDSELSTEGSQEAVQDIIKPSQDQGDKPCHSEAVTHSEDAIFALPNPKKIRFPAVPFSSAIQCKWEGCGECFKTHAKLSDHIKTTHVVGEESGDTIKYSCRWVGCKVFGKKSSSMSWLERHVPRHGSKFTFDCIVEGCRMRFSSQAMLERHVNSHFPESNKQNNSAQSGPRKSIEGVTAKKRLKRAGVRLKFRQLPFSARIFDFFDAGLMSGIRHYNSELQKTSYETFNMRTDSIEFHSKIISIRKDGNGSRQVQLKWIPEDLLPDQWVPLDEVTQTKTVKISNLPEKSKQKLNHQLLFQPERRKQSRKTKRQDDNNLFLTPAEVRVKEARLSSMEDSL